MLTIAATHLAQLAQEPACARCFWIMKNASKLLPFQRFPSVFRELDKASKNILSHYLALGQTPPWMKPYVTLSAQVKSPHWSKFHFTHAGLQVRGEADVIAKMLPGETVPVDALFIGDFKTAMLTAKQDELIPIYAAQLGCYALAAEQQKMGRVLSLGVIYCQPQADGCEEDMIGTYSFRVAFDCRVVPVDRNDLAVYELCERAVDILSNPLPAPTISCDECTKLEALQFILSTGVAL